jgi:hypothetical protein
VRRILPINRAVAGEDPAKKRGEIPDDITKYATIAAANNTL